MDKKDLLPLLEYIDPANLSYQEWVNVGMGLKQEGYTVIAVEQVEKSTSLSDYFPGKDSKLALVFGNEVKGVQQEVVDLCDLALEIPQFGTKHSFNISVSAGIVLWDLFNKLRSSANTPGRIS